MTTTCNKCGEEIEDWQRVRQVPVDPFDPDGPQMTYHELCPQDEPKEPEPAMTGHELLQLLRGLSDDDLSKPVTAEGCDCVEAAVGITVDGAELMVCRGGYGTATITPESEGLR